MKPRAKTIQIFLPSGDPRGIQVASITTGITQVIEIPRALLADFQAMPESRQVGVYYLIGEDEETGRTKVYIGQTGILGKRLNEHHLDSNKEFWNQALVVISLTQSLTQTHALYLEWRSIQQANHTGRYTVINGNSGSKPHTPAWLEADCEDIFDTIRPLVSTLGQYFMESLAVPVMNQESNHSDMADYPDDAELFYCYWKNMELAKAQYTEEGMVVLKGSKSRIDNVQSFQGGAADRRKQQLILSNTLLADGDYYIFQEDTLFKTPSSASDLILGRPSNGWIEWRNTAGKTLDFLKRHSPLTPTSHG